MLTSSFENNVHNFSKNCAEALLAGFLMSGYMQNINMIRLENIYRFENRDLEEVVDGLTLCLQLLHPSAGWGMLTRGAERSDSKCTLCCVLNW